MSELICGFDNYDMSDYPEQEVSNCCGASIIAETDICYKCGEHCEVIMESEYFDYNKLASELDARHREHKRLCAISIRECSIRNNLNKFIDKEFYKQVTSNPKIFLYCPKCGQATSQSISIDGKDNIQIESKCVYKLCKEVKIE